MAYEWTPDDVKRVFALQGRAVYAAKTSTAEQRIAKLQALKDALLAHQDDVCAALKADLRRPRQAALSAEVYSVVGDIDEAIANLAEWMAPVSVEPSAHFPGAKATIRYEARGRVLILGAWNFPIGLVLQPLVPAIAAGNVVIVKPNEVSPASSKVVATILREAFDEQDVAVFEGGIDLANELLALPFDHVFFTGSPKVGKAVMAAAAQHLASVTLELGGKSPVIIDRTADLGAAALKVGYGRCTNAGQLCLAPDHVWVENSVREEFLAKLEGVLGQAFYAEGKFNPDALGKLIDGRNFARVSGYIDDAVARGAKVRFGGGTDAEAQTIEPTVLTDVPLDSAVMEEEIFGPVLPVIGFDSLDEPLAYIQAHGKPLAAYMFSQDRDAIEHVLANTSSGGVTLNGVIAHVAESRLPFGGVNQSGIGRYHGVHGFKELSHERAVFEPA